MKRMLTWPLQTVKRKRRRSVSSSLQRETCFCFLVHVALIRSRNYWNLFDLPRVLRLKGRGHCRSVMAGCCWKGAISNLKRRWQSLFLRKVVFPFLNCLAGLTFLLLLDGGVHSLSRGPPTSILLCIAKYSIMQWQVFDYAATNIWLCNSIYSIMHRCKEYSMQV